MPYRPPTIEEIGLPQYVDSKADSSNGLGWTILDLCFQVGVSNTDVGKLFKKDRKTIAGWRKIYKKGGYNNVSV